MIEGDREDLVAILRKFGAKETLKDSDRIFHDIGIGGDDIDELFEEIHRRFGTRFEGFEFDVYFPIETDVIFYHYLRLIGFTSKKYKPLTFGHLLDVVRKGRWYDPQS
jgi:hypothetical protein